MANVLKDIGDTLKSDYEGLKSWAQQIPGDVKGVEVKQKTVNEYKGEPEAKSEPAAKESAPAKRDTSGTEKYIQSLVDKENAKKAPRKRSARKR